MRVALIMPTVRAHAGRVAEEFLDDARASGVDLADVSLYFSTDPPLRAGEPRIGAGYAAAVHHVGAADRAEMGTGELVERLLATTGYASARNAPLLAALRDGHDVAVFIDDDVHPHASFVGSGGEGSAVTADAVHPRATVVGSGGEGSAVTADDVHPGGGFLRSHLDALAAGADVTRGGYLGHGAPLVDLSPRLGPDCRAALGLALSLGNEVLPADCLTTASASASIPEPRRGLVIYGGNLGVSLAALAEGRIPPFFCPPGARGEDTFFGLRLPGRSRVVTGAEPVWHDPFRLGRDAPAVVPPTPAHLRRFAGAVRGWVRYAPLWLRTQHADPTGVLATIASIYAEHARCLDALGLGDIHRELACAVAAAEREHALLDAADVAWRTEIVPRFRA